MAETEADKHINLKENSMLLQEMNRNLEQMLEQVEKLSVKTTCMAYDMALTRSDPALTDQLRGLEDAFLKCREEVEEKWRQMLEETRPSS
ncbi:synaptonemal complex central element protein 3 isoform X2 [Hyperolius riggenbachi]